MTRYILQLLFLLLSVTTLQAQDLAADLKLLGDRYSKANSLSMEAQVSFLYKGENKYQPYAKALLNKQGEQFRYTMGNSEMLMNSQMLLVADHHLRMITCRPIDEKEWKALHQQHAIYGADTLLKSYDSIVYRGISNGNKVYTLYNEKAAISKVEITLDATQYWLKAIEYKYSSDPENDLSQVRVEFSINEHPVFPVGYFEEKQFIVKQGNVWKAQAAYQGYEVYMNEIK